MSGFYYSTNYNLMMSRERLMKLDEDERNSDFRVENNTFYWNFHMYDDFDVPVKWRTPIMQGYFHIQEEKISEEVSIKLGILSRRQYERGGTRLNARGIDDNGFVGNFVETEMIAIMNKKMFIHTQIRGSLPLFWKQVGLKGDVKIKRDLKLSMTAFKKHFRDIVQDYNKVLMISLLKEKSEREEKLSQAFSVMFTEAQDIGSVEYGQYDFHANGIK